MKNKLYLDYICIPVHLKRSLIIIVYKVFTRWNYNPPNMGHKLVCYLFRRLLTWLRKHFNWAQRDLGQNNPEIPMTCTVTDNEWRFFFRRQINYYLCVNISCQIYYSKYNLQFWCTCRYILCYVVNKIYDSVIPFTSINIMKLCA